MQHVRLFEGEKALFAELAHERGGAAFAGKYAAAAGSPTGEQTRAG